MSELRPDRIMAIGAGFSAAKVLLSAVGLRLFTELGASALTTSEIAERLELVPRPARDFLDALVSLDLLARDGDGLEARYRNTAETAYFLDESSPGYHGGLLTIWDQRNYRFWADLTDALRTGESPLHELRPAVGHRHRPTPSRRGKSDRSDQHRRGQLPHRSASAG